MQLYVDCPYVLQYFEEKLSYELDSMLSADHFVERLTSLNITNTPITRLPASVCKLFKLNLLNLDDNNFSKLPDDCFTKLTKLMTLSVKWNSISGLQDGLFDGLQSLVTLDLSYNDIGFIGLRVFSNSSDLISLSSLNLAHNKLTSLEPWPYFRSILGSETSIVKIDLHDNLISNFTNKLKFEFRCGMKPPYLHINLNQNRIAHIMDIVNWWNIGRNHNVVLSALLCYYNHQSLARHININLATTFDGGSYECDCTDFQIYKIVKVVPLSNILDGVRCNSDNFYSPGGQPYATSIPLIEFVCEISDRCPSRCRCVYRPANATFHVYCSATNLSSLPLDLPPLPKSYVKYKLDFSNNKLVRLENRPYFVNTSVLDVSNCSLTEINMEVLKNVHRLSVVNLRGNTITSFPRHAETMNISARLFIGGNPWRCSCDDSWMIGWLQSLSGKILDPGEITCALPSKMYGRNVLMSTEEDFCVDPVNRDLITAVSAVASVVALVVVLAMSGLLFYKLRLRVYRKWKLHPFDRDECVGEDMDYDVFFCCSSEDDNQHGRRIVELTESNGYRVCYHERDFFPGQLILDNIALSIERSKRTVCLLSTTFLER